MHIYIRNTRDISLMRLEREFLKVLSPYEREVYGNISNQERKKQWLTVRKMLSQALGFYIPVAYTPSGKPVIPGKHISISHSYDYAALAISDNNCAIDIQKIDPRIQKIKNKFLIPVKDKYGLEELTLIWSAKETMFKLYAKGEVDFKKHMKVKISQISDKGSFEGQFLKEDFRKILKLHYFRLKDYFLVYTEDSGK